MIISGCSQHNRISQKDLFTNFYGYAAAICNKYVTNENDLVEVVNDGFLKIFKEIHKFDTNVSYLEARLKSWIKSIMVHTSIDYFRKKQKEQMNMPVSDDEMEYIQDKNETPLEKLTYDEIISLVNQLSPMYKLVFNLSVIDGMKHDEIAKTLGISEGTSKSNLFKARQQIIKLIENKYNPIV